MRVEIEPAKCITSGQCVMLVPEVFDQDDEGVVMLLQERPGAEHRDAVVEAVAVCPGRVIRVVGN